MSALRSKQNLKLMGRDGEAISESTQVAGVALKKLQAGEHLSNQRVHSFAVHHDISIMPILLEA
jgi:hypothetical protein